MPEGSSRLDATFPMSRYFRAFDLAVAAAGYNAFHELIAFGVPTLFVPMARATPTIRRRGPGWAAEQGVGAGRRRDRWTRASPGRRRGCSTPTLRERTRRRRARAPAPATAPPRPPTLVAALAAGKRAAPEVRHRGRFNRWFRHSSHPRRPEPAAGARR